jgi:hypothetical protein
MKIGIIGTAGRGDTYQRMSRGLYFLMVKDAQQLLRDRSKYLPPAVDPESPIELVSGGAAWADHIAVSLYLAGQADALTVYLPCGFDRATLKFVAPREPESERTAQTANWYHDRFSQRMGRDTRHGLVEAELIGARLIPVAGGFKIRNLEVGKVDLLIAYTWGPGIVPADGGTKHTWDHASAPRKLHRPLGRLEQLLAGSSGPAPRRLG